MKFVHYSDTKYTTFKKPKKLGKSFKPNGCLWLSDEKEWLDFLKFEMGKHELPNYKYSFDILTKNLYRLKTYSDIKQFNELYGFPEVEYEYKGEILKNIFIDWDRVRKENPDKCGIWIQTAKNKKARAEFTWYYSVDVQSVILWDNSCITGVVSH